MPKWLDRWTARQQAKADAKLAAAPPIPEGMPTTWGGIMDSLRETTGDLVASAFDPRADVIDPGDADFRNPPELVDDPSIAEAERSARDEARAPYRAPDAVEVVLTRFATTGEEQMGALARELAAYRPDRVFGVHRTTDRFDEHKKKEDGAYLEWEIAHAPDAGVGTPQPVDLTGFSRQDRWARRAPGQLEVLDEDMVGVLVSRAALEPSDTYGLSRLWSIPVPILGDDRTHTVRMEGILAVASRELGPTLKELAAAAPMEVGPPPFEVVTLDWQAIAAWNQPKPWLPPRTPAALPHLPTTPQELLVMFLEVVGIRPEDCYAASPTRTHDAFALGDLGPAGISRPAFLPKSPCVDGKDRARRSAAEHVVVAYRDRPEYAAGRERFAAYETEVLHARLTQSSGVRETLVEPIQQQERDPLWFEVINQFNPLDPLAEFPALFNRGREIKPLGAYCP